MDCSKFTSKLKVYSGNAARDGSFFIYVPVGGTPTIKSKEWYGRCVGTVRYAGRCKYSRDKREVARFIETDNAVLYGLQFHERNERIETLPKTHEEVSQLYFGVRGWGDLIDAYTLVVNPITSRLISERSRDAGIADKKVIQKLILLLRNEGENTVKNAIELTLRGGYPSDEFIDTARCLSDFNLSVQQATELKKSADAGRKISVVCDGIPHDYKQKTVRKNLHDFIFSIADSYTRRNETKSEKKPWPKTVLVAQDGFVSVTSASMLIKISRENGWCAGDKYYRALVENGQGEFFFNPEQKILSLYHKNGKLSQARAAHNSSTDLAAPQIEIKQPEATK